MQDGCGGRGNRKRMAVGTVKGSEEKWGTGITLLYIREAAYGGRCGEAVALTFTY